MYIYVYQIQELQRQEEEEIKAYEQDAALDDKRASDALNENKATSDAAAGADAVPERESRKSRSDESINQKPGARLKEAKTGISEEAQKSKEKRKRSRERFNPPPPQGSGEGSSSSSGGRQQAAGSYYAFDAKKEQEEEMKKREEILKQQEKSKISSMSGDQRRAIESKLDESLRAAAMKSESEKHQQELARQRRHSRYRVSRKFAEPVEKILRIYNNEDDASSQLPDLYKILGVSHSANPFTLSAGGKEGDDLEGKLRKSYRALALVVHPDKNPHPDAKAAFDALQDAFETLSSPAKRKAYDEQMRRILASRRLTPKRFKKIIKDKWINFTARFHLFIARMKNNQWRDELAEWQGPVHHMVEGVYNIVEHFTLLPTIGDRVSYYNEMIWRYRRSFLFMLPVLTFALDFVLPSAWRG